MRYFAKEEASYDEFGIPIFRYGNMICSHQHNNPKQFSWRTKACLSWGTRLKSAWTETAEKKKS